MILAYLSAILFITFIGRLLALGAKNRLKYQFFKKNAPGLKVVENPSLFGGHTNQVVHVKHNWANAEELIKKFGPTFGFYYGTRPAVITIDLDFIKIFTVDEQIHTNRIKANLPMEEFEEDCIMFAEDEQWVKLRKLIAPAFVAHRIKLPNVQSDINKKIDALFGLIERRLDETREKNQQDFIEANAEDICHRYTLALVFSNFYKQHDIVDFNSEEDKSVKMIDDGFESIVGFFLKACAAFPSLKPFVNWLVLNFDNQGLWRNTIMRFIKEQTKLNFEAAKQSQVIIDKGEKTDISTGKEGKGGKFDADNFTLSDGTRFKRNMIDYIIDNYREGKLTEREYYHSTFFLFFAAYRTTGDSLSRILYNLAYHQDAQEKLRQSIMAHGTESEYLSWVINESLRLCPPAPIGCSRVIKRDIQTKHGLVPAGTFVVTPANLIGRLKEYWGEDADEFRPERWANSKSFHPCQYLAFGGGRRACPGKELALMELKMVLDKLIRKYKFEKSNIHTIDNSKLYDAPMYFFLTFDTPTFVRISRIESSKLWK